MRNVIFNYSCCTNGLSHRGFAPLLNDYWDVFEILVLSTICAYGHITRAPPQWANINRLIFFYPNIHRPLSLCWLKWEALSKTIDFHYEKKFAALPPCPSYQN